MIFKIIYQLKGEHSFVSISLLKYNKKALYY